MFFISLFCIVASPPGGHGSDATPAVDEVRERRHCLPLRCLGFYLATFCFYRAASPPLCVSPISFRVGSVFVTLFPILRCPFSFSFPVVPKGGVAMKAGWTPLQYSRPRFKDAHIPGTGIFFSERL